MRESPTPVRPASGRAEASIGAVQEWLFSLANSGSGAKGVRRLSEHELLRYPKRNALAGWRIELEFADTWRLFDLLADRRFPRTRLRVMLLGPSRFLQWPHVEKDGDLCLLAPMGEVDPASAVFAAQNLLWAAYKLVEASAAGKNEDDFRSEFFTYWDGAKTEIHFKVWSLLRAAGPTRVVQLWQRKKISVFGESSGELRCWLENLGYLRKGMSFVTRPAVLLWLPELPLPQEYPRIGRHVMNLAETAGPEAIETLRHVAAMPRKEEPFNVIIGAETANGPCLAAVTVPTTGAAQGFRKGRVPPRILAARALGGITTVLRSRVDRVDSDWIHGRGQDQRSPKLKAASVAVLGCGSLGGPLSVVLAQAGVGKIALIDHDSLEWANVGRHPLGAESIGDNKAVALAAKIRSSYPHVAVEAHSKRWEEVAAEKPEALERASIIISAIGDWSSEGAVNEWHVERGRTSPIVYGWAEAHACAGHAVAITALGGCLQCGMERTGSCKLSVTEWPSGGTTRQEPACGAVYQPYGPIEMMHVVNLVAELVLDCLLGTVAASKHSIWAGRKERLQTAGGAWSAAWSEMVPGRLEGGFLHEREWEAAAGCIECDVHAEVA
jgi:sulfur-carrier protein adenylyltransferase/sulfurtransferase